MSAIRRVWVSTAAALILLPTAASARCPRVGIVPSGPGNFQEVREEDIEDVEGLTGARITHIVCADMRDSGDDTGFIGGGSGTRGFLAVSAQHVYFVTDRRRKALLVDVPLNAIAELRLRTYELGLEIRFMFVTVVTDDERSYTFTYRVDHYGSPLASTLCRQVRVCRQN